jgi:methoxymalonate biosynthesis protein
MPETDCRDRWQREVRVIGSGDAAGRGTAGGAGRAGDGAADLVKCLVWDLDGTLWQGSPAAGEPVRLAPAVLDVVRTLDRRGVLQSVAGRNDPGLAWARLEQLGVADYLVLPRLGWGPKSAAVRAIAAGLGLAERSMAYVDDEPAECAEVARHVPDVRCYPAGRVPALPRLPEFSPTTITLDARRRRERYQAGFRRKAARSGFTGPAEEFLRSLGLTMLVGPATGADLPRVAELTGAGLELSASGPALPWPQLRALLADPRHRLLLVTMTDRFGPHGAVGFALLHRHPTVWHLKLLITSCRVVSFGTNGVLMDWLLDRAAAAGVHLVADFQPTDRNQLMAVAYRFAGLAEHGCDCQAGLDPAPPGHQRLHVLPTRQEPPGTMLVRACDPGSTEPGGDVQREWMTRRHR